MIHSIPEFLKYFKGIRRRTISFAEALPADKIAWQPSPEEYSCGDIIRHLGSAQLMHWGIFSGEPFLYPGHGPELGETRSEALDYLKECHQKMTTLLLNLPDETLFEKRPVLEGDFEISAWRYLMINIEHEVHHRSQLASYFYMLDLEPPQLYGVYMEDLPR